MAGCLQLRTIYLSCFIVRFLLFNLLIMTYYRGISCAFNFRFVLSLDFVLQLLCGLTGSSILKKIARHCSPSSWRLWLVVRRIVVVGAESHEVCGRNSRMVVILVAGGWGRGLDFDLKRKSGCSLYNDSDVGERNGDGMLQMLTMLIDCKHLLYAFWCVSHECIMVVFLEQAEH